MRRQKEAKAAFLAIRRHLRLARRPKHSQALARANSAQMRHVASEFLLRSGSDAGSGALAAPGKGVQHYASVLCFDEMQVRVGPGSLGWERAVPGLVLWLEPVMVQHHASMLRFDEVQVRVGPGRGWKGTVCCGPFI